VQVRAGARQPDGPAHEGFAEHEPKGVAAPQVSEAPGGPLWIGGDEGTVHGANRGADDKVGADPGVGQRAQHADLVGAEQPAAAEYECDRHLAQANRGAPERCQPGSATTASSESDEPSGFAS
jgi:hypothetical protein